MDISNLRKDIINLGRKVSLGSKLLREAEELQKNPANATKLITKLRGIEPLFAQIRSFSEQMTTNSESVKKYISKIEEQKAEYQRRFASTLAEELKQQGLSLTGQYPELKIWILTIEVKFGLDKLSLWYGPKQEFLGDYPLDAVIVAKRILQIKGALGSRVDEGELIKNLRRAYKKVKIDCNSEQVPIGSILLELALIMQDQAFLENPIKERFKSYSRADFSFDLFRIKSYENTGFLREKPHLTVATRALTNRHKDFIWVPDDMTGKGTTYSHLEFKEMN
jgi:hypothetical protein